MTQSKKAKKTAFVLLVFLILAAFVRFYVLPKHFFPKKYSDIVEKYAAEYGLDENLVYAMIKAESNFNPNAVSNKDARGLMQISESTGLWGAEELNIPDYTNDSLFDPEINIKIGCCQLLDLRCGLYQCKCQFQDRVLEYQQAKCYK